MRRVYIDEAGDRGAAAGSSRYFVVSAVVVEDADDSTVRKEMSRLKLVICKKTLNTPFPDGGLAYIAQPDPMYLWAIRLLLERVSWFIRDTSMGIPSSAI